MITAITVVLHNSEGPPTYLDIDAASDETSVEYLRRLDGTVRPWLTIAGPVLADTSTTVDVPDPAEAAAELEARRVLAEDAGHLWEPGF